MPARHSRVALAALAGVALVANAQEPLSSKHFTWPNIPYQVTGDQGGARGPQAGFNLCNSTTESQDSDCQTAFLNNLGDFCMWSSGQADDTIGESEAREFAWCTAPGHGTRVIPPGTITGAQWLYAKNYVQVVGYLDQTKVNLDPNDAGGELDPHGADEQGNPLGGIVFSNGFGQSSSSFQQIASSGNFSNSQDYVQVIEWIDFIGSGIFCLKMCNPNDSNAASLCNHIYDEIGCTYNAVANYAAINGTFEVCDSEDMTPPGVYVENGVTSTWFQPQSAPFVPPYTPTIPASSNCVTYASTQLFAAAATDKVFSTSTSAASQTTGTGTHASSTGSSSSGNSTGKSSASVPAFGAPATPFLVASLVLALTTVGVVLA